MFIINVILVSTVENCLLLTLKLKMVDTCHCQCEVKKWFTTNVCLTLEDWFMKIFSTLSWFEIVGFKTKYPPINWLDINCDKNISNGINPPTVHPQITSFTIVFCYLEISEKLLCNVTDNLLSFVDFKSFIEISTVFTEIVTNI